MKITKIAVIGLGYVGLPLSLQFAKSGVQVLGLDIDAAKVGLLSQGKSYIQHINKELIADAIRNQTFAASTDFSRISDVEAVIICVPTPLKNGREPDISFILKTGQSIAPHLSRGMLVVLESTTYPGTTEQELRAVLEEGSGLKAGADFHLAFSPEREDPGNPLSRVADIPKVVGGYSPACLEKAMLLYGKAVKTLVPVSSCRVAEAAKLLENIFRSVNIALVNELKVVYEAMDIDIWEVVEASRTKPFGFMPFYPGPGLGGHCIPIDPFYLSWKAKQYGKETRFIELAGQINTKMPEYVAQRAVEALTSHGKKIKGARVLLLGLAYKPDVDDMRESPTFALMDLFKAQGAEVAYYDPHVPDIKPTREHGHWTGTSSVVWTRDVISRFDLVVISTAHRSVNYHELGDWAGLIVDTRNAMAGVPSAAKKVCKA